MLKRIAVPVAAMALLAVVAMAAISNRNAHPTTGAEPTSVAATTTTKRANWSFGEDGAIALPKGVHLEINSGLITGIATDSSVEHPERWNDLLGTRYTYDSLDDTTVTRQLWRQLKLELPKPDGSIAHLEIARPLWWLQDAEAAVGAEIDLAMHEVGIEGIARVTRIGPCEVDSRENTAGSEIVIGTIKHENATVLNLVFNNDTQNALGVTANHPIYSHDRDGWLPAGDLKIGEQVQTVDGTATLTAREEDPEKKTVYNLEVHRAHTYYVSQFGILAHNTGIGCGPIRSATTNRTVTNPRQIALGRDPVYKSLADSTGAARYQEWADVGLTRRTTSNRFGRAFHQATARAEQIHFDVDGIDDLAGAIQRGKAGFSVPMRNVTNAELHHIVTNADLLAKTKFYPNGVLDDSIMDAIKALGY